MQTTRISREAQSLEKAYLVSISNKNQIIDIGDFLTIGRNPTNSLILEDGFSSQRHARIEKRGSEFVVKDLRSTNGTYLNETQVLEARLSQNDRIRIGESVFVFTCHTESSSHFFVSKNSDWQKQLD
ncbi:MAG: FHA domain-containing protein, partial [Bdellovibrionaceae bacterium]|nr:FHA domain-containing protein [Pseudobdellovibrionaceae bacterium]